MPSVKKGSKVLVSGANGFLAMWVVRTLLERGFTVRGTVRTEDKGKFMIEYFKSLGYDDKLEIVVVDDIVKEGAFDEVVKGVDAIELLLLKLSIQPRHFISVPRNPKVELINPAVQGTLGMLKSAFEKRVQRIVVTSSCASVLSLPLSKPTVFSEQDWNSGSIKEVQEKGNKCPPSTAYRASKTLAEKCQSAWDFYELHKAQIKWDLAVINPPFVFGPAIHDIKSPSSLNTSLQIWYEKVVADSPKTKESLSDTNAWVDVRDTALGHVLALEKDAAGGQRIITAVNLDDDENLNSASRRR